MNEITQQVTRARRRLNLAAWLNRFPFWIGLGLVFAFIAWVVPKVFPLGLTQSERGEWGWQLYWLGGCLLVATLVATWRQWRLRSRDEEAAREIDARFGLKERVGSALSLSPDERTEAAGECLVSDASARAARIDVRDEFGLVPGRRVLWALVPALALAGIWFLPPARPKQVVPTVPVVNQNADIKAAIEKAKEQIEEKKKQLEALGLKDMAGEMDSLGRKLDELDTGAEDLKKEALVQLNDLREQLEQKQAELGNPEDMRKTLGGLKDLKSEALRELNDALRNSDFQKAQEALNKTLDRLKAGELTEPELRDIGKDLAKVADEISRLAREHEEQKQQLRDKLKEAQEQGDLEKAAQLQEQLEKKEQADKQMQKLQEMANKLQQAGEQMQKCADCKGGGQKNGQKEGKPSDGQAGGEEKQDGKKDGQPSEGGDGEAEAQKAAADALEDMMEQMEQMELDQESMEALQDLEQDLQECKDGCNGQQPGQMPGQSDQPKWQDWAKGEGRGGGKRELEETETGEFKSRVKGQLQKGQTIVTGDADGENSPGGSMAEAREVVRASMSKETDPLSDQQLERWQRQHAMEYFQKLRGDK